MLTLFDRFGLHKHRPQLATACNIFLVVYKSNIRQLTAHKLVVTRSLLLCGSHDTHRYNAETNVNLLNVPSVYLCWLLGSRLYFILYVILTFKHIQPLCLIPALHVQILPCKFAVQHFNKACVPTIPLCQSSKWWLNSCRGGKGWGGVARCQISRGCP